MDSNLPPDNQSPPPYGSPPSLVNRPPPVIFSTPPPGRSKGNGWRVLAIIVCVVLALSLLLNFRHAVRAVTGGGKLKAGEAYGPRLEEVTVRNNDSGNKIVVVPVDGVISGTADSSGFSMVSVVKAQLKLAKKDNDVKAVILKVDSPGGEVLASDEIANAIRDFENGAGGKPVVVSMGSLAASGGYYISAPCDWIVANEMTITGSIGVIMEGLNYRGLLDKIGVRPEVYKSGKFKDIMSPVKSQDEISPEERAMIQNLINETYAKFKKVVGDGRAAAFKANPQRDNNSSQRLSDNWADFADGRILSGTAAKDLGLVDELGDFDVAVKRTEKLASLGAGGADLVEYRPVFDLANLFHLLGQTDAKSVKIDLGVEIPKLRPGCQYFLLSTYLQ